MLTFKVNNLQTAVHYEFILWYQQKEHNINQFMQIKTNSIFSGVPL